MDLTLDMLLCIGFLQFLLRLRQSDSCCDVTSSATQRQEGQPFRTPRVSTEEVRGHQLCTSKELSTLSMTLNTSHSALKHL